MSFFLHVFVPYCVCTLLTFLIVEVSIIVFTVDVEHIFATFLIAFNVMFIRNICSDRIHIGVVHVVSSVGVIGF